MKFLYILGYVAIFLVVSLPWVIYFAVKYFKAKGVLKKYFKTQCGNGLTGEMIAKQVLLDKGIDIEIEKAKTDYLIDNFDYKSKKLTMPARVFSGTNISSFGVAMYQVGQAVCYSTKTKACKFNNFIKNVCKEMRYFVWPIFVLIVVTGFVFIEQTVGKILLLISLLFFVLCMLLPFLAYPMEKKISKTSLNLLSESKVLNEEELMQTSQVIKVTSTYFTTELFVVLLPFIRVLIFLVTGSDISIKGDWLWI